MSLTFSQLAARWPARLPFVGLAGSGRYSFVAAAFSEVDFDELLREPLPSRADLAAASRSPFVAGWMGVLSYDDLARHALGAAAWHETASLPSRIFRVSRVLVHDALDRAWHVSDAEDEAPAQHALTAAEIGRLLAPPDRVALPDYSGIELRPGTTDEAYRRLAADAIEQIRGGRFYQINLLRYFTLAREPERAWILSRMARLAEPFACYVEAPGLTLASLSPERFVRLTPALDGSIVAEAEPVKGTAPRAPTDPTADRLAAAGLLSSAKDRAELHMIVDLLRNDLNRIAQRGSVEVVDATRLTSHAQVHHLSARIQARLPAGLPVADLLQALCPGGSITGAPKREVMLAIRAAEGRPRGLFMGNAFYLDRSGRFDSSVLIRTLVRTKDRFEYAAGSGLTVNSDPEAERLEIRAKARVVEVEA